MRRGRAAILFAALTATAATANAAEPAPPAATAPATAPAPAPAPAKTKHRLVWKDEWPRFRVVEYGTVVALYAEFAFVNYRTTQPTEPNWQGGILFDDAFRSLRLRTPNGRIAAARASDYLTVFDQFDAAIQSAVVPIVFDHANFDVAWQLEMMNAEAGAVEGLLVRTMNRIGVRGRPSYDDCKRDFNGYGDCGGETSSFPSGHSMAAFTGAGLTCAHHMNVPLYGGGVPDGLACALDLAVATGTSTMRLLSDNHWASDIFLGGFLGFGIGFGMPNLLHYRPLVPEIHTRHGDVHFVVLPRVSETDVGAIAVGMF